LGGKKQRIDNDEARTKQTKRKQIPFEDDNQNDNGKNEEIGKGASRSHRFFL
jgi:hypothetical protein